MRLLNLQKQIANPQQAQLEAQGVKSAAISQNLVNRFTTAQPYVASAPDKTMVEPLMQEGIRDTSENWMNSFANAIDEIDKSNYSGKRLPHELKIKSAQKEILDIQNQLDRGEISEADAATKLQDAEAKIREVEDNPEYQKLNEKVRQQEMDINESPVDKIYSAEQAIAEQQENSSVYNFLKYELPKELGGSASEIGTQLATAYGPKLINALVKRAAGSALSGPAAPWVMGAMTLSELGAGMYGLYKMRDAESDAEVNDAYEQKVAQAIAARENEIGGPISEEERLNIEIEAHKGLDDVKAQNMNLMLGDAMEVLLLASPWKGVSSLLRGGKVGTRLVNNIATATSAIEDIGRVGRWGRLGMNAFAPVATAYSEGMEEADQYGIKAQYLAGKYSDNNTFWGNVEESVGHRISSGKYAFTGESGEDYENDADYRNAFRSGAILGGLMGSAGAVSKIYSDEKQYRATAEEMKAKTPAMLEAEKAVFRSEMYSKYFGNDKSSFLFEGLENLAKTSTNPEHQKAAVEELAKAKEGYSLYKRLNNNLAFASPEEVSQVYKKAQHITTTLQEMKGTDMKLDAEYSTERAGLMTTVPDPILNSALEKKAFLEAAKANLDQYYTIEDKDKPSNIRAYEKSLEEKYAQGLNEYKEYLEGNNLTEKTVNEQKDIIKTLASLQTAKISNELVRNDLQNHLTALHTTKGARDFLANKRAKIKPVKPFNLNKATLDEYLSYEKSKEAESRVRYNQSKIEKEAFEKNLGTRLGSESIEDILEEVNLNTPRLTKKALDLIKGKTQEVLTEKENTASKINELEEKQIMDADNFTSDDNVELERLRDIKTTRFDKAYENFSKNEKKYTEDIPEITDNAIKRNVKNTLLKGARSVQAFFDNNNEYDKIRDVEDQIEKVTNLKKIYEAREEGIKTSKEFEGFGAHLDETLARLEEIKTEVLRRLENRDRRDQRIPINQTKLVLNSLGINLDGTVIESKKDLNDEIKLLIGEAEYQSVIDDAEGALTRVHADILIQLLKNSTGDKSRLNDEIEIGKYNARLDFLENEVIYKAMPHNQVSNFANLIDAWSENPDAAFSKVMEEAGDKSSADAYDKTKESSIYKYVKEKDLGEFINDAENETRPATSRISKEQLLEVIDLHIAYSTLFELERELKNTGNLEQQLSDELAQELKYVATAEKNKGVRTPTPSNQQMVALKQLYKFGKTKFKGTEPFDGFAYMKGFAGTGKTNVVMRWMVKLLGLKKSSLYTVGHNTHSAKGIATSLGIDEKLSHTIDTAIADIPSMSEDVKLIIVDEAPGIATHKIKAFAEAVAQANKTRKNKLKVVLLGDPNQRVAGGGVAALNSPTMIDGAFRMTHITPLTIRFRSDVSAIVDVQDMFIDQPKDLTRTTIHGKTSTLSFSSSSVLGVAGSTNFEKDTIDILAAKKDNDTRTKAIIVGTPAEVTKYEGLLADAGITNVEVMTVEDSQGRTIDEVYTQIKYNSSYNSMQDYNTDVYTATSRASKFLFIGGFPVENSQSDMVEQGVEDRTVRNAQRSKDFIDQHNADISKVEKFIPELPEDTEADTTEEVEEDEDIEDDADEDTEAEVTNRVDDISDEDYKKFKETGEVSKDILESILDKIIAKDKLTEREDDIFNNKGGAIEEIRKERARKEEDAEGDVEVTEEEEELIEEDEELDAIADEEELTEEEPEVVTIPETIVESDAKDLDDLEGNSQPVSGLVVDENTPTHILQFPSNVSIAVQHKDGSYGQGVKPGDRIHYVIRKTKLGKQVVLITHLSGEKYREIGVLSDTELRNPPLGFEAAYGKLLDEVLLAGDSNTEEFRGGKGKVYKIVGMKPIMSGTVTHSQRLAYQYASTGKPLVVHETKAKFLHDFFPLDNLLNSNAVKWLITPFTNKKIERAAKSGDYPADFVPLPGVTYLELSGLQQKGKEDQESKKQLIRLSPAKLNTKKHGKLLKPIQDYRKAVGELQAILTSIEGMEGFRSGTAIFAKFIKSDKKRPLYRKLKGMAVDADAYAAQEKKILKLVDKIDKLVYVRREENVKAGSEKKIFVKATVAYDGEGESPFKTPSRVVKIKDGIATLKNGKQIPTKDLIRVAIEKRYEEGAAFVAFKEIAKANKRADILGIQDIELRKTKEVETKDGAGNVTGSKTVSNPRKLFEEKDNGFGIELLDAIFDFDEETGDSRTNRGFGLRVPISRIDFPEDGNINSDIKIEDYFEDTFVGVLPASVTVTIDDAVKVTEVTRAKAEEKEVVELPPLPEDEDPFGFTLAEDRADVNNLGNVVAPSSVFGFVKRFLPNATSDEVRIVSNAQMLVVTGGRPAWGYFKKGLIYLLEGANGIYEKVIRHEAFHKVFNENFTRAERRLAIRIARRDYPELRNASNKQVEEFLAEKFQNWKDKQGFFTLPIVNFFKKLLNILGLYRTNMGNIESIMADIDNGILGKKLGEIYHTERAMLDIRGDFMTTTHFRLALNEVTIKMSNFLNATSFVTTGDKKGLLRTDIREDGSNIEQALSMDFGQAMAALEEHITTELELRKAHLLADAARPEGQKQLTGKRLEQVILKKEMYEILADKKKREAVLKTLYPSLYLGKTEFRDTLMSTEEEIRSFIDMQAKGISDDAMDADRVDHEKKMMRSVKDLLSTIIYEDNGALRIVDPKFGFLKLLEAFSGVNTTNLYTMLEQIQDSLGDGNAATSAIYERIEDLVEDARRTTYRTAAGKHDLPINRGFIDSSTFFYDGPYGYTTIRRPNIGGKLATAAEFARFINEKMNSTGVEVSYLEIKAHHDQMKARQTIAAIRASIGSLRKKNVMVAVRSSTAPLIEEGKVVRGKKMFVTSYRYNSVREQGAKQTIRSGIETALMLNYDEITDEQIKRIKGAKTKEHIEHAIREFLQAFNLPHTINIPTEDLSRTHEDIKAFLEGLGGRKKKKFDIEALVQDSENRLKNLVNLVSKDSQVIKAVSYVAGDGTKRYEWINASFGIDVLQHLASPKKRQKQNANNFEYLSTEFFQKYNPFVRRNEEEGVVENTIHAFADHDSIKDKDNKYKPVKYADETKEEWFMRTFSNSFLAMLTTRKEDEKGAKKYIQWFYTISNKPNIIGAEINLKSDAEIKKMIADALAQEKARKDFNVSGYNTAHTAFARIDKKTGKPVALTTVKEVNSHLESIAEELAQQFLDNKYVLDHRFGDLAKTLTKEIAAKFTETKGEEVNFKAENNFEGIARISKSKEHPLTKAQILPIIDLFVKNYYMNGHFMNQLVVGDQAFYGSNANLIKRMSVAFAMGYTGMVNDNGWMKRTFKVAVGQDINLTIGSEYEKFKKFYGINFDATDGIGFMTQERYDDINRGFSPEMNNGYTLKPVYFGIDKYGVPRAMKYSSVVLSKELCAQFPELEKLRRDMVEKEVGEFVFESGFKVGSPKNLTEHRTDNSTRGYKKDGNWYDGINPESIVELENKNWRIQLNPLHDVQGGVSNPTQLTYFSNLNGLNRALADRLYELNAKLIERGTARMSQKLGKGNGNPEKIAKEIAKSLGPTEARLYEFLTAKDEKGRRMISLNFPAVVNKVVTQLASSFSKGTVKIKYPGAKLNLQPEYAVGIEGREKLQFRTESTTKMIDGVETVVHTGYAEVIMPNMYKGQFLEGDILSNNDLSTYLGFRIPSTELHSAIPLKIVGFYDSKGTNVVIAPNEIVVAHGSDYDIDALFVMRREAHKDDDYYTTDKNGVSHLILRKNTIIGRDAKGKPIKGFVKHMEKEIKRLRTAYKAETDTTKKEGLKKQYKKLDKALDAALKNEIVDTFLEIVTAPNNLEGMMTPITTARLDSKGGTKDDVFSELRRIGVKIEAFIDLNNPMHQQKLHSDNFSGTALVGSIADMVRGFAYILQGYTPEKTTINERLKAIKETEEGKALMEEIKAESDEVTLSMVNGKIKDRVAAIEKQYNITYNSDSTTPTLPKTSHMTIDDVLYDRLSRTEIGSKDGIVHIVSEMFDALINAALDNVKLQILPIINMTNNTGKPYVAMLAMGVPINTVVKYMISPSIQNISMERNAKTAYSEEKKMIYARLEKSFNDGDVPISKAALKEKIDTFKVTSEGLDALATADYDKLTPDQLLLQYRILKDFGHASRLGTEIDRISKATKILKEFDVTAEQIQEKMDIFTKLRNTKSAVLIGVDIMKIPHINAAYKALSRLNFMINTNFNKHRIEIQRMAQNVHALTGLRFDYNEQKNLRMIRDEVTKFFLSGISYKVDGVTYDFDTSNEKPYKYRNYKDEDRDAVGVDAWNQRFVDEVQLLKTANPKNRFLIGLSVQREFGTGMNKIVFNGASALEAAEIMDIQDDFKKLMVDGKFTKFQRDFVKYSVLNNGLTFGSSNYTLLLPVELYKEFSDAMDNMFEILLNDKRRSAAMLEERLKNITPFMAVQAGANYVDSLLQPDGYVKGANGKSAEYGVDETLTGKVVYDMKYPIELQGEVEDKSEIKEEDGYEAEVISSAEEAESSENEPELTDVAEDETAEDENSTQGKEKVSVKVLEKLPLMIRYFDRALVRLETRAGDSYIYYREVTKKKYSKHYYFNKKLLFMGYSVNNVFRRDSIIRSVVNPKSKVYEATLNANTKLLEVGSKLTLRSYNDIAQINTFEYVIKDIELLNEAGEKVEDRGFAVKVRYNLAKPKEILILDITQLSQEDSDDYKLVC